MKEEICYPKYMKLIKIWDADITKAYALQMSFPKDENGFLNSAYGLNKEEFTHYCGKCKRQSEGLDLPEGYVPCTVYLLEDQGNYVGIFNYRPILNAKLRAGAGHIGYGIRKEYRGRGYAQAGLNLLKEKAKAEGIPELYLSCQKNNGRSLKVQLRCGAYIHHEDEEEYYTRIPLKRDITILVACHQKSEYPTDEIYLPIQLGAYNHENIGYIRDDSGENISSKNDRYSELTGLYWAYKNLDSDIIGLVHYRRYFLKTHVKKNEIFWKKVLQRQDVEGLMKRYKIIVPKKRHYYIQNIWQHYADTFTPEHLEKTREIIKRLSPEYLHCFDEVMKERSAYMFNMFIMSQDLLKDYATWLFPILEHLDWEVDSEDYSAFEKRYLGRISERLWNVWLQQQLRTGKLQKRDIYAIPYAYLGKVFWGKKVSSFLLAKFFHKKYKQSF